MSDTPRTDAVAEWAVPRSTQGLVYTGRSSEMVSAEFARQLERELDGLRLMYAGAVKMAEEAIPAPSFCSHAMQKDWGRAQVGLDGNCGFALLGANLQEGEAEFVEIEGWPHATYKQERAAWGEALRRLEKRLGSGPLRYEVIS